jgi:ABC-type transport system involved in multi-copper enzyme maturation permease subunit
VTALLAAEVLKLRTTRTFWGFLAATVTINALAVAGGVVAAGSARGNLESARNVRSALGLTATGAIFVLVLGIILAAGEYRHGTSTDTFLTTPDRWRVIAAKLAVAAMTGATFGAVSVGASLGAAGIAYAAKGLMLPLTSADAWATLGGAVLFAALFGAIGAATGSLIRNQVVAIAAWLTWLLVVEHIAIAFFPSVSRWLPTAAGRALVREPTERLLSVHTAAVVLAAYAVAIMAAAVFSERYRDA